MAFKKLEAGPSEFFVNVGQPLDEQDSNQQNPEEAELQVPESEVEDLNSSDSDYPAETSERNRIVDMQEEVTQTSLVDAGKQMVEAWRNARVTQGGKKSSDGIRIPIEDLEGVDVGQIAQDGADDGSDPLNSTLTEETPPTLAAEIEQSSLPDERDDPILTSSDVPVIQASSPPPLNVDSTSPTMVRKYGTYRKKRSSLSPNKTRSLSSSSDEDSSQSLSVKKRSRNSANSKGKQTDSDNNNTANLEVENSAGTGIQRRGTFTKEVPTIRVERTRPLSTTSNSSDQDDSARNCSAVEAVDFDDSPTESGLRLKRSGTFTKSPAPESDQAPPYTDDGTCTNELAIPADSSSPGSSNLRRSGTFTKEKPDVIVIKTRVSSTSSASASDISDAEMELMAATTTSGLKRSGTFTKETSTNRTNTAEEQLDMLQMSADLLHYDLDDTLKDTLELAIAPMDDSSSEESVKETLILTDASPIR